MGAYATYGSLMVYILPICCSVICSVFALLLIWNYRNLAERKLRRVVSLYCLLTAVWWAATLWHAYTGDKVFLPVDIPFALSFVYIPILFFNAVYYLTYLGNKRNFSALNYLLPVPVLALLLMALAAIFPRPEGNIAGLSPAERYTLLFITGPFLRFATAAAYIVPTVLLLSRYYRQTVRQHVEADRRSLSLQSSRWLIVLFVLSVAILLIAFLPVAVGTSRWLVRLNAACIMAQVILLTYHVVRRQYLSYKTADSFPVTGKKAGSGAPAGRQHHAPEEQYAPLNRKKFEAYIAQRKPYLNPDFKLTDMAEAMGVNRTVMSSFINRTYGMNFRRYLNLWRIEEYHILMAHPSKERKDPRKVMSMTGFKDSRHFRRATGLEHAYRNRSRKGTQTDRKP
ncbi:MAG: AraC family transcriptional regulator [Rikenellaceae bacterium]|nr:AraC family transcriptional regulator [Rikenellaceae bacterium]